MVNSTVQQDLVAASGSIDISDQAVINSDVIAAGGSIIINGNVGGDLRVAADTLIINGIVGGNITADVGSLEIGDQAVINGNIKYRSDKEATIADGAQIQGNVEFEQRPSATEQRIRKFFAIGTLLSLISSFLLLLLLAYLLPRLTRQVIDNAYNDAGSSLVTQLGLGLATLIVTPFVILLLMISFIGARIGWVLLLAYALLLTLAASYSVILLGVALWKLFKKEVASPVSWTLLVIALIVAVILNFIPVLGWLILFIFFSIALGSLATITYNAIVKYRK
ncbi:MAG: Polymer-forming cytoskeletal [bacterium ADurb.Bin400]|nr:MAG: Polymer-forming cytoskeletal [bacterium ADurb.Bin400]